MVVRSLPLAQIMSRCDEVRDDFVHADQYCSWSNRTAYCFMSGSLRMPYVRSLLLCKLFCSILSSLFISMSVCIMVTAHSYVFPFAQLSSCVAGIRHARQYVRHHIARIVTVSSLQSDVLYSFAHFPHLGFFLHVSALWPYP